MKLSIIVPVYNVEQYVEQCVKTLLLPDIYDYEIIIVNDGTKDRSIEIIKNNIDDSRVRIIEKQNGGLSSARNFGIKEAKGEYIWCFDSDDWAETCLLSQIINELKDVDLLYFNSYFRNYDDKQVIAEFKSKATTGIELACEQFWHPTQFYIIKKEIFEANNLFYTENIIHEDSLFTPIMLPLCKTVRCFRQPVYHHRQREGSITHSKVTSKKLDDLMFVTTGLLAYGNTLKNGIKFKWGHCIAQIVNELLFFTQECTDAETKKRVKILVNNNSDIRKYLFHSNINNKIMSVLSAVMFGNLYAVYGVLYKFRY